MNLRGWIPLIGLGVLMAGCAPSGTTPSMQTVARPDARAVAQALLGSQKVQSLAVTERVTLDPEASRARLYRALGAEPVSGTYQALKATLEK